MMTEDIRRGSVGCDRGSGVAVFATVMQMQWLTQQPCGEVLRVLNQVGDAGKVDAVTLPVGIWRLRRGDGAGLLQILERFADPLR